MAVRMETKDVFRSVGTVIDRLIWGTARVLQAVFLAMVDAIRDEIARNRER